MRLLLLCALLLVGDGALAFDVQSGHAPTRARSGEASDIDGGMRVAQAETAAPTPDASAPTSTTADASASPAKPSDEKKSETPASTDDGGDKKGAGPETSAPAGPAAALPFVDLDGDLSPTPVVHTFRRENYVNGKVGTGLFLAHSWPFNGRTGYVNTFAEGDASGLFGTGLGFHWDVEVRGALSAFEARSDPANATNSQGVSTAVEYLGADPFYRHTGTFVTGRTTDYLRIDRLALSYDVSFFGVDLGRSRIPEAALTVVDGLNLRFDFGMARFGLFGGLKPNPWHQQVVGAGSGGFVPVPLIGDGAPAEHVPVVWGTTRIDPSRGFAGETTGPYSNDIGGSLLGQGYPWTQVGSYRFQTLGLAGALRFNPAFFDAALVVDTFYDPNTTISATTGELVAGTSGFQLDRVWLYTSGGARLFDPLTISWRGTLDVIGARPLQPRDLFFDITWRNLGPVTLSLTYFKINTFATAYSFARFFRPLENPSRLQINDVMTRGEQAELAEQGSITPETNAQLIDRQSQFLAAGANINNTNLFVVDRDRVTATAAVFLGDSFQLYSDLVGERRNDFMYVLQDDVGAAFQGYSDSLSALGDTLPQQFLCSQPQALETYDPNDPTNADKQTPPPGLLVGSNRTMPVWADRCKLGFSLGMRDPFLGRIGTFDLRFTQLWGYFSSTTRLSARLGVAMGDRLSLDFASGFERNDNHRVYQPGVRRCAGQGPPDCNPVVITAPQNGTEAADTDFRFLPWPTNVYDMSASLTWRILAGWFAELSYFGVLEEIPYMGDYFPFGGAGDPQRRDTVQFTQVMMVRTLYRF